MNIADRVESWIIILAATIIIGITVTAVAMQERRLTEIENRLNEHLKQPVISADPYPLGSYNLVATYMYPIYTLPQGSIVATLGSNLLYVR